MRSEKIKVVEWRYEKEGGVHAGKRTMSLTYTNAKEQCFLTMNYFTMFTEKNFKPSLRPLFCHFFSFSA